MSRPIIFKLILYLNYSFILFLRYFMSNHRNLFYLKDDQEHWIVADIDKV